MRKVVVTLIILAIAACLRVCQLDKFPPAPYWEEVALGYDAYSIAQTGRDHHGHWLPIVAFESFGDWKPGGYIYALVPFVKVFGLETWVVRLPAAISGILIVWGIGELSRVVSTTWIDFKKSNKKWWLEWLPLVAMAVATISPWLIMFSRAAWEVNLAACLILWGVVLGLKVVVGQSSKQWLFGLAAVLLVLSMYTYHAARLIAPSLGLGLLGLWWSLSKDLLKEKSKLLILVAVVTGLLLLPLTLAFGSKTTSQRFAETSIFSNLEIINESNARIEATHGSVISRVLYHRGVLFGREIFSNWLSHFRFDFLFLRGDQNARHSIVFMGQLYHIELIFLLLGAYVLVKNWNRSHALLIFWMVIAILPASITYAAPHALRILPVVPVFMYVISLGVLEVIEIASTFSSRKIISRSVVAVVIGLIYVAEFLMFWRFYTLVYPKLYGSDWLVGYQELVTKLQGYHLSQPDKPIVVIRKYGRPAMYYWYYTKTDPTQVQALDSTVEKDQGEFLAFESLRFVRVVGEVPDQPSLVAIPADTLIQLQQKYGTDAVKVTDHINDLAGTEVWTIVELK